jgi:RNA polymerase sigma-70 factor (ECF subfamily)
MATSTDKIWLDRERHPGRGVDMDHGERAERERSLRKAVLAGDEQAWRAWYEESFAALDAYVSWRCGGLRDLADEVLQETWLIAVRRVREFDPEEGRFLSWLCGIAANVLRNRLRERARLVRKSELLQWRLRPVRTPGVATEQDESAEQIARALDALPERYEDVLRAKYLDQRSVADIAAEWKETPKAIESLLTRARQAFRDAYNRLE